ncbi:hypothetical protein [Novilysobacter avium]|uniref:Uncharacterized protein n=1 Tax=Novilysobacter avium TaxID=2781023 RepID=A0A7S6UKL8_9GAMM|nr:hypothetical protein [Lysobacter avium]QOW22026.1 hypothetical protein INQ42_12630 [Lysobacter avium]
MQSVQVETDGDNNILISQEIHDLNEPDPVITVSPDQAALLASWIIEASGRSSAPSDAVELIPVKFFSRGPEAELEEMSVYNNSSGMIILSIDEDTYIEISPAMAKRMRDHLSKAISLAFTDMLRGDDEV